jgi:hypothetical protein
MYEIIQKQFKRGKTLTQSKYYNAVRRDLWPKYYWDFYPLAQEYYHELNPYFLFNFYQTHLFSFSDVITVRDGYLSFANFLLNNVSTFEKLETGPMFIHPDLAPLVPQGLTDKFATWNLVQKKKTKLEDARRVVIFGLLSDEYLGSVEALEKKIQPLKNINPEATVEVYLPLRKNIFELQGKDSVLSQEVISLIKDVIPQKKIKFLTGEHFFEITNFKNAYLFDLAYDKFLVSDNYLHYYMQSRGATVNNGSLDEAPADSIFSLDMSFHHELHISPLPKVRNVFTELIFYKKSNLSVKDFQFDPGFQTLLREILKVKS